jgi:hypothetical protein
MTIQDNNNNSSTDAPKEPVSTKKTLGNAVSDFIECRVLKMPKKPAAERLATLTDAQKQQLQEIEDKAITHFEGQLDELESALGMLRLGHHFGWKVLYLIHSKRTIRKYEGILDIKVREIFTENGPSSYRSYGFNLAETYSNFWKVAGGDIKIPDRKKIE